PARCRAPVISRQLPRAGDRDREGRVPRGMVGWPATMRLCGLGAGDDDVAEVGDGLGHAWHEPGHLGRPDGLRLAQQRLRGRLAAGLDHLLADDGHEFAGVEIADLSRRELGCHCPVLMWSLGSAWAHSTLLSSIRLTI